MATNFAEWERKFKLAAEQTVQTEILKLQRKLAFITLGAAIEHEGQIKQTLGLILRTPVMSGRARASWNLSTGKMNLTVPPPGQSHYDPITPENAVSALKSLGLYDVIWIASGLPYINVLEYGGYPDPVKIGTWNPKLRQFEIRSAGGFSKQAAAGMLRVTLDEVRELFAA